MGTNCCVARGFLGDKERTGFRSFRLQTDLLALAPPNEVAWHPDKREVGG